jgi:hypothetical protein
MIVLLIVSWTLNIALGTALFLGWSRACKDRRDRVGRFEGMPPPPCPVLPDFARDKIRQQAIPMHKLHKELMSEMHNLYCKEQLDTVRFQQLVDTMAVMKGQIERSVLSELARIHPTLTPEQRQRFFPRSMERMSHKRKLGHTGNRVEPCPLNEEMEDSSEHFPACKMK